MTNLNPSDLTWARGIIADVEDASDKDLLCACSIVQRCGDPNEAARATDLKRIIEGGDT